VIEESALPEGWTLARVRDLEPTAALLDPDEHYVVADTAARQMTTTANSGHRCGRKETTSPSPS
jgi:hypothetical protein